MDAEERAKRRAEQEEEALRHLLSQESGKIILWGVLTRCQVFCSSYSTDAAATAFREGRRSIGLELLDSIQKIEPKAFPLMMIANQEKLAAERLESEVNQKDQ